MESNNIYPRGLLTPEQMNIITSSRRLWLHLTFWLRDLIISTLRDPERIQSTANHLFQYVVDEFYRTFEMYYGSEVAQQFANQLTSFLSSVWQLAEAEKTENQEAISINTQNLYQTADSIASLMPQLETVWDAEQWRYLLYQYIRLLIVEIVYISQNKFDEEIDLNEDIEDIAVIMGNYMARGFIAGAQIPQA